MYAQIHIYMHILLYAHTCTHTYMHARIHTHILPGLQASDVPFPPSSAEGDEWDWPDEEDGPEGKKKAMAYHVDTCLFGGSPEEAWSDATSNISYSESENGTVYFDEKNEAKFQAAGVFWVATASSSLAAYIQLCFTTERPCGNDLRNMRQITGT